MKTSRRKKTQIWPRYHQLDVVRRLLADLPRLLRSCGGAVLEIGDGQAEVVADLAGESGLAVARRVRDVSGCERVVVLQTR